MGNMQRMLTRLRDKEIGFGQFVVGTRPDFRNMALYMLRRWEAPPWYGPDDVEQELYLGCWDAVPRWDPSRGVTIARFAMFGAMARAKRALHKARGVPLGGKVHPDRAHSRHELAASTLGADDGDGAAIIERMLAESPAAEVEVARAQEVRAAATAALRACMNPDERTAVLAIREAGSLDGAPSVLYDDVDSRVALRLGCEDAADRYVRRHATAVARRVAATG